MNFSLQGLLENYNQSPSCKAGKRMVEKNASAQAVIKPKSRFFSV